jgi:hypothetical protein
MEKLAIILASVDIQVQQDHYFLKYFIKTIVEEE